jgi:hypothetical protein
LVLNIEEDSGGWVYNFCPLLSPSIKEISVCHADTSEKAVVASALFATLQHRGAKLEEITYHGILLPPVFHNILNFASLHHAIIDSSFSNNALVDESHVALLQPLRYLTSLTPDLGAVKAKGRIEFGKWLTSLPSLIECLAYQQIPADIRFCCFNG